MNGLLILLTFWNRMWNNVTWFDIDKNLRQLPTWLKSEMKPFIVKQCMKKKFSTLSYQCFLLLSYCLVYNEGESACTGLPHMFVHLFSFIGMNFFVAVSSFLNSCIHWSVHLHLFMYLIYFFPNFYYYFFSLFYLFSRFSFTFIVCH